MKEDLIKKRILEIQNQFPSTKYRAEGNIPITLDEAIEHGYLCAMEDVSKVKCINCGYNAETKFSNEQK